MFGGWGLDCTFDDEDDPINNSKSASDDDDATMSPVYSDQCGSDVEERMYGKIHHSLILDSPLADDDGDDGVVKNNSLRNRYFSVERNASRRDLVYGNRNFPEGSSRDDADRSFSGREASTLSRRNKKTKAQSSRKRLKKDRRDSNGQALTSRNRKKPDSSSRTACSSSDDEVVFVSAVKRTLKQGRSSSEACDPRIVAKTCKGSSTKKNRVISVSSDDSSDEMICIDSVGFGDDLMTNVRSNPETYSLHDNSSSSSSSANLADPVSNIDSSGSNATGHSSETWHINAEDRMTNYLDKKSRKRKWVLTCKQCKGPGHHQYQCSYIRDAKCYLCGGSHKSWKCDKKVCGLCYSFGHDRTQCSYPMHSITCGHCKVVGHMACRCPDIWRRYHITTSPLCIQKGQRNSEQGPIYCYNCGIDGHLGHECCMPRLCRESIACLPYIISYKDPNNLMKTAPWEGKRMKKKMIEQRNSASKFSKASNFQRTPRAEAPPGDSELVQLLKVHKRRSFKKRRKGPRNMGVFLQRTSL